MPLNGYEVAEPTQVDYLAAGRYPVGHPYLKFSQPAREALATRERELKEVTARLKAIADRAAGVKRGKRS